MKLSDDVLNIMHGDSATHTEVAYRMAWTRTYLKVYGLIENSKRAIWSLTQACQNVDRIDPSEVTRFVNARKAPRKSNTTPSANATELESFDEINEPSWRTKLRQILLTMSPSGFERLTQRLLRESGFSQVEVTGKSGDGGIDGKGILKVNELMSFHMMFQCKRYQGSVSAGEIRNFRGAMQGRVDKGLFITTGAFTRSAEQEATRDGAPPIELVDGEELMDMLCRLQMGITPVTSYAVAEEWFRQI